MPKFKKNICLEKSFGLLYYLKQTKNQKNENRYIYLRITVDGERREISTKRQWVPDQWNAQLGRTAPTISKWLNSSVAISISISYLSGCGILAPKAWVKYCMAAASSPFSPPNCSNNRLAKKGSGRETLALNCRSFTW